MDTGLSVIAGMCCPSSTFSLNVLICEAPCIPTTHGLFDYCMVKLRMWSYIVTVWGGVTTFIYLRSHGYA